MGRGGGEYKKNIGARENKMKKNSCTPINPKKYSCYGLKNWYKEFDNEKIFLRLENSPSPPITFLMVRPLRRWAFSNIVSQTIHLN